jgi:non-ribosomal peptide synthetase component F
MAEQVRFEDYPLRGPWARLTLPGMVEVSANARPDRTAFIDAPDRANWCGTAPATVTSLQMSDAVQRTARQLLALGLKPGERVIVACPNHVDGIVALVAVMRCGCLPCPVNVVSSAAEIRRAAEAVEAAAIITEVRYAHLAPAMAAVEAARSYFGIRLIIAFGDSLPDGVVSLNGWTDSELFQGALPALSATAPALISFDMAGDGAAHTRTHSQLISEGLALAAVSGLTSRGSILATFAPVSAAGVVCTLAAPLVSGAKTHLHGPFDLSVLDLQMEAQPDAILVMPAPVETAIRKHCGARMRDAIVVQRAAAGNGSALRAEGRTTDLHAIGEVALVPVIRSNSQARLKLPRRFGHPVASTLPQGLQQIELSLSARGHLSVQGFGVAQAWSPGTGMLGSGMLGPALAPLETRWLAHGDGTDYIAIMPDDRAADSDRLFEASSAAA